MVGAVDGAEATSGSRSLASSEKADAAALSNGLSWDGVVGSSKIWVLEVHVSSSTASKISNVD